MSPRADNESRTPQANMTRPATAQGSGPNQFLRPIPQVTTVDGKGHCAHAELFNAVPPGRRQPLSTNEYQYGQTVDLH